MKIDHTDPNQTPISSVFAERKSSLKVFTPWLLPWAFWLVSLYPAYGLGVAYLLFAVLDGSHRVATLPLSFFDRGVNSGTLAFCSIGAAVVILLGVIQAAFPETVFAQIWFSLWIYWGAFHIVRQHYGFLRLYQAKQKTIGTRYSQWETRALYSGCGFPYLLNLSNQWIFENEGSVFYKVVIPDFVPWLCLAVFLVSILNLVSDPVRRKSISVFHVLLAVSNFWVGILWVGRTHFYMAALFITSFHNVQYHGIVWQVGQRRFLQSVAPAFQWVRALFRSKWLFLGAMLAGGFVEIVLQRNFPDFVLSRLLREYFPRTELFLISIVASYKYLHYLIDGRIWLVSKDPRLASELRLD